MPIEAERLCGFRMVGKIYIVGSGISVVCDNLPYPLKPCDCCGFAPQFIRGFSWLKKEYIKEHNRVVSAEDGTMELIECDCIATCPICHPNSNSLEHYGLMWVGEKYYTPENFVHEAEEMGVSKAINKIPKDVILGKTWILLAHPKVPFVNAGIHFIYCFLAH